MEVTATSTVAASGSQSPGQSHFPSGFTKYNSALTAGLLNPMSPPPEKTRSSPTLFEMMANEPDNIPQQHINKSNINPKAVHISIPVSSHEKQAVMMQRVGEMLYNRSPGNQFNDVATGDVKLTLSSKDGISVSMSVHRQILVANSRFFAAKLLDRWSTKQQGKGVPPPVPYSVEIADCDDVEVYVETLRLMYSRDLRRKLMREDVTKILGILKVSAAIGFDAGVLSCLEYLEAAPWAEEEEEKVASLLLELRLDGVGANDVLKRVSMEVTNDSRNQNESEHLLGKLLKLVIEGKDEKARREMKGLVSKMLRDNSSQSDVSKECMYSAFEVCLKDLRRHIAEAAEGKMEEVGEIARQADNVYWIAEMLMDRYAAEELVKVWAGSTDMAEKHSKVAAVHRYEVSRVTARMFVGIGKGQVLACKDTRWQLLQTWLTPFYSDFGWLRRVSKGLDRHLVEDGLSSTILTLPMERQQEILLAWFHRFVNSGEDCPNIQRGFEVWWRRAFWRRNADSDKKRPIRIIMEHHH